MTKSADTFNELQRSRVAQQCTWVGFACNVVMAALKLFAGVVGRSSALIADGVHSVADLATGVIVLIFMDITGKAPDKKFRYGHGKFETLATAIIAVVLGFVAIDIFIESQNKVIAVWRGEVLESPGQVALWIAAVGILAKLALYFYTTAVARRISSAALKANAWHYLVDVFAGIATLLGIAGAIFLGENWRVLDPIAASCISIVVLGVAVKFGKPAFAELLEASLPAAEVHQIEEAIGSVEGVNSFSDLRCRRNGIRRMVDVTIYVDASLSVAEGAAIASNVETTLNATLENVVAQVSLKPQD